MTSRFISLILCQTIPYPKPDTSDTIFPSAAAKNGYHLRDDAIISMVTDGGDHIYHEKLASILNKAVEHLPAIVDIPRVAPIFSSMYSP